MTCAAGCCPDQASHYRSLNVVSRLTKPVIQEGVHETGERFKAVTDELNNTVTQIGDNRQDVLIRAVPPVLSIAVQSPVVEPGTTMVMDAPVATVSTQQGRSVIRPSDLGIE